MEQKKNRSTTAFVFYVVGIVLLTFLDQITKIIAVNMLKGKKSFTLINGVLEFSYLENQGAAWGMLTGARVFFIILTISIVILITIFVFKIPKNKKYAPLFVSLTILCAGAIGNLIDRFMLGYVRDFIYFKLINFPVFNVADIYVTVSVILLVVLILFVYKDDDFDFFRRRR